LDSNGNLEWAKTFGGGGYDYAYSIQQTSDGGYIVGGYTYSFGAGNTDFLVIELDSNGNLEWAKTFGGGGYDYAYSIQQTSDGGYIVAGRADFGAGGYDFLVIKLDSNGNITGCSHIQSVSPTVTSPTLTVTDPSLTVNEPTLSVSTPSLTVTTSSPTETSICYAEEC
ncbi:hypothetical protein DRN32_02420, partial [Thermococci archaeon]